MGLESRSIPKFNYFVILTSINQSINPHNLVQILRYLVYRQTDRQTHISPNLTDWSLANDLYLHVIWFKLSEMS